VSPDTGLRLANPEEECHDVKRGICLEPEEDEKQLFAWCSERGISAAAQGAGSALPRSKRGARLLCRNPGFVENGRQGIELTGRHRRDGFYLAGKAKYL